MRFIAILACITIVDCLTGAFGFMNIFDPLPPDFAMSAEWRVMLGLIAAITLIYQAIRFAMWLASLTLYIRTIAEGVVLQAWNYTQGMRKTSHIRIEIEKGIVRIGKNKLGYTRVRSAKGVVSRVMDIEPAKREKPVYDGPRVVAGTEWKDAA